MKYEVDDKDRVINPHQSVKVVGKTIFCNSCNNLAEFYCACGQFFCFIHLASHRCLVQFRTSVSKEILNSLR